MAPIYPRNIFASRPQFGENLEGEDLVGHIILCYVTRGPLRALLLSYDNNSTTGASSSSSNNDTVTHTIYHFGNKTITAEDLRKPKFEVFNKNLPFREGDFMGRMVLKRISPVRAVPQNAFVVEDNLGNTFDVVQKNANGNWVTTVMVVYWP